MTQQLDLIKNDWLERSAEIVRAKFRGREFCADDLHGVVNPPPHHNWYGKLFQHMKKQIILVGHANSKRPERAGGLLRVWKIKENL